MLHGGGSPGQLGRRRGQIGQSWLVEYQHRFESNRICWCSLLLDRPGAEQAIAPAGSRGDRECEIPGRRRRSPKPWVEFARDSPLEGDGFEPSVPVARRAGSYCGRRIAWGSNGSPKKFAGYRRFESISLQRRVSKLSV